MLNSSIKPFKSTKINECIMRRRARNLRAKVKALLPVEMCCKYDHRNKCVHEIEHNRRMWAHFNHNNNKNDNNGNRNRNSEGKSGKRKWTMAQEKENCYYYEKEVCIDHQERFQKLTQAEIQQIKEDRLYYLGEENLEDFQEFLKGKNQTKGHLDQLSMDLLTRTIENFQGLRLGAFESKVYQNSTQKQQKNHIFTETSFTCIKDFSTNKKQKKMTVDQKLREFEQRRKTIEYQQKSKNVMNKVKMNMRLERAQAKLRQIRNKQISELSLRKQEKEYNMERVTNRRRNYHKKGQIKQLEEQLRRTFMTRKTRTANQLSRTSRTQTLKLTS